MPLYTFGSGSVGSNAIAGSAYRYSVPASVLGGAATPSGVARHTAPGASQSAAGSTSQCAAKKSPLASTSVAFSQSGLVSGEKRVALSARLTFPIIATSALPPSKSLLLVGRLMSVGLQRATSSPGKGIRALSSTHVASVLRPLTPSAKGASSSSGAVAGIRLSVLGAVQRRSTSSIPVAGTQSSASRRSLGASSRTGAITGTGGTGTKAVSPLGRAASVSIIGLAVAAHGAVRGGQIVFSTLTSARSVPQHSGSSRAASASGGRSAGQRVSFPSGRASLAAMSRGGALRTSGALGRVLSSLAGRIAALSSNSGSVPGPTRQFDGERVIVFDAYPPSAVQQRVEASGGSPTATSLRVASGSDLVGVDGHSADVAGTAISVRGRATQLAHRSVTGLAQRVSKSAAQTGRTRASSSSASASADASTVSSSADSVVSVGHSARVDRS